MKPQSPFQFTKEQQEELREALKEYFVTELDTDLGNLQSDMLIEFLHENVGKHYYNLGVTDTIAGIEEKAKDLVLLIKE